MNIKIQIQRNDIGSITRLINLMFQINIEFIDYVSFYNLSNILKEWSCAKNLKNFI